MFCGYELSEQEYANLQVKADSLWNIYDQLNDSIRSAMPDSIVFEVFLSLLTKNEVGIDVIVPRNKKFFETVSCAIMNSNYSDKMPLQRYLCLYSYTKEDGSGDSPLEIAVKRIK